jgi:hypothetical protein
MRHLIFWGAGATQSLGIRTTVEQEKFICSLTDAADLGRSLQERVSRALGRSDEDRWRAALFDLITILGDDDAAYRSIGAIEADHLAAMRRNWQKDASEPELRDRITDLRLVYDWPALKSVVRLCPGRTTGRFKLNDLFNLLDMHIPPGSGFRDSAHGGRDRTDSQRTPQFLDVRRLVGARNALLIILIAMFYIDYRVCIDTKREDLEKYRDFLIVLGRRMQTEALRLPTERGFAEPEFYQGDVSFVSINYDPIALWAGFIANRELNHSAAVPHIGSPAVPLHLFHDMGHLIPSRGIAPRQPNAAWYPMNEAAAQRLNELSSGGEARVRLTKFLFPHGSLCWRECPDCGKLSAYHGDNWDLCSRGLIPPPPLRSFDSEPCPAGISDDERGQRERGAVDARKCLHCDTMTFAHHTQVMMQSSFKPRPPSFIEEIERDLRATTMRADHVIFMGYSLPLDDVTYRAFLSARRQCSGLAGEVHCTVVGKPEKNPAWYGPDELKKRIAAGDLKESSPVQAARDIFGEDNVRLYTGGIPGVFLDQGKATAAKLERLLTWSR